MIAFLIWLALIPKIFAAVIAVAIGAIFALFAENIYNFFIVAIWGLLAGLVSGGAGVISSKKFIETEGYKKGALFVPPFIGGTIIFLGIAITLF